ncbi:MAG: hypothetical protein Q9208_007890 [Pyrenodesmia sp. 3 TL-2023]
MHSSTLMSVFAATLAVLATPAFGAAVGNNIAARSDEGNDIAVPSVEGFDGNDIVARSAELDAREADIEARGALLVCQFGGVKACSVKCVALGHIRGGYCNRTQ